MKTLADIPLADNERAAIEEAARRLKAELPVSRVVLFGSKARGTGRADSDIDLLILTRQPVTGEVRRQVSLRLTDASLDHDVLLSSVIVAENEWEQGAIREMLIHSEVQRDGAEL